MNFVSEAYVFGFVLFCFGLVWFGFLFLFLFLFLFCFCFVFMSFFIIISWFEIIETSIKLICNLRKRHSPDVVINIHRGNLTAPTLVPTPFWSHIKIFFNYDAHIYVLSVWIIWFCKMNNTLTWNRCTKMSLSCLYLINRTKIHKP